MTEFSLSKIGIIMLGVTDMEQSLAFYRDRLGLKVAGQSPGFAFLNAGSVTLALSEALTRALGDKPGPVEVVFSVDHVRGAYEQLRARGIEFPLEPRPVNGPMWAANFTDPAGHALSIFGPE